MSNTLSGQGALNYGSENIAVGRDLFINYTSARDDDDDGHDDEEEQNRKHRQCLLKSLRFANMDEREWNVKRAQARTCEWFLQNPEYLKWLDIDLEHAQNGFLWIKGKPGAGKSTLTKFLLGRTRQTKRFGVTLAFFFNARAVDELKKSTLGLYRSLSTQLFQEQPQLEAVLDSFPAGHQWCIESLKELLERAVQRLDETSVAIFVDALDECKDQEVRELVAHFNDLCHAQPRLHVCFTSRHYPYITVPKGGQCVVLEQMQGHGEDIAHYIQHTLQLGDGKLSDRLRADLLQKASGVFMWVVLVVSILNKMSDAGEKHKLPERLRQIPADLHDLFRDMLTRDNNDGRELLICIQWVLFARYPLTSRELYFAIVSGVDPESLSQCHSDEITNEDFEKFVLDKSKGLTELNVQLRIQFIHESVRDFLLKGNGLVAIWPDAPAYPEGPSHQSLTEGCLAYIKSEPVAQLGTPHTIPHAWSEGMDVMSNLFKLPFLEYATWNILSHANEAETYGHSQTQFLTTFPCGKWIIYRHLMEGGSAERDKIQFRTTTSLLYILARYNLDALVRAYPVGISCFQVEEEVCGTPLFAAFATGHTDAAKALIKRQIIPEGADLSVQKLLHEDYDYEPVSSYFRSVIFDARKGVVGHLAEAGDKRLLKVYCATERLDFRSLERSGKSPLLFAADRGHRKVAQILIDNGADINAPNSVGDTPLHIALKGGDIDMARLLIKQGANINAPDRGGRAPLHIAVEYGCLDVARVLIEEGADVSAAVQRRASLDIALSLQHEDLVKLLIHQGARLHPTWAV
ncbi:uncharacterized protein PG986_008462 [Apiospora aurea]|uniref:Nephrocystin 3-like N-terminal domain-containing protein n=1 Tax=Apiospora aurea TaxID=335848 RepID=A0ABR1QFI9_9PEZI